MSLCLYQGTFNPPHLAHLAVAEFVADYFALKKVLFIPAANPPHKSLNENPDEALHRLNMTKLLVMGNKRFEVSDIEFERKEKSYTFVTVKQLYEKLSLCEKPYFVIGDDAFAKIESWYHSDELKELINFVVLPRDEDYDEKIFLDLREKGYNYTRLNMPKIHVSSTEIRERVSKGLPLDGLTTKEVEKYIYEHNLYKNVD